MKQRGFTLVEVLTTCTLVGLLASIAIPGYQSQLVKSRRGDAVAALTLLQAAQERQRSNAGGYSADFGALRRPSRSEEGLYTLAIELTGADSYRATAQAVGPQAQDHDCPQLELRVNSGFAEIGPSARCWNR